MRKTFSAVIIIIAFCALVSCGNHFEINGASSDFVNSDRMSSNLLSSAMMAEESSSATETSMEIPQSQSNIASSKKQNSSQSSSKIVSSKTVSSKSVSSSTPSYPQIFTEADMMNSDILNTVFTWDSEIEITSAMTEFLQYQENAKRIAAYFELYFKMEDNGYGRVFKHGITGVVDYAFKVNIAPIKADIDAILNNTNFHNIEAGGSGCVQFSQNMKDHRHVTIAYYYKNMPVVNETPNIRDHMSLQIAPQWIYDHNLAV